jgi:hypothetical protein
MPVTLSTAPFGLTASQKEALSSGITLPALDHIRALIAGAVTYSTDKKDLWGEAYISATGRNSSVTVGSTTATFLTNKYYVAVAEETATVETDGETTNSGHATPVVDIAFTVKTAGIIKVCRWGNFGGSGTITLKIWNSAKTVLYASQSMTHATDQNFILTLADYVGYKPLQPGNYIIEVTGNADYYYRTAQSFAGTHFEFTNQQVYSRGGTPAASEIRFTVTQAVTDKIITQAIPANSFVDNPTNFCFKALTDYIDTGKIYYKISNGTDDSGYFLDGEIASFAAFASKATTLTIKLEGGAGGVAIKGISGLIW